jgi:hypothetical protein
MISESALPCFLGSLSFEKTATFATILFEVFVVTASLVGWVILSKLTDKLPWKLLAMGVGVLIFVLFTGPMWINERMGPWAYLYNDLSWILTLGWTTLILGVVVLVDRYLAAWRAPQRFAAYILVLLVPIALMEVLVVKLGIRSYSPEVRDSTCGVTIRGAPIEILFYAPVFTSLVITFYKYWSFVIDQVVLIPVNKRNWARGTLSAFIAVFLFEVMIEPMIENKQLPAWSYVYHDISLILIASWVLIIGIGAVAIERHFLHLPMGIRFLLAVMLIGVLAVPLESWLALSGYRVFGPSMVERFTGLKNPITGLPAEIGVAVPCYLALIVAFIRYWEVVLDNRL